jgi:hypothetical protein
VSPATRDSPLAFCNVTAVAGAGGSEQHAAASQYGGLCRKLWPALLRLAAGGDAVAWQLFGALLDQIVHWLARWVVIGAFARMAAS